MAAKTVTPQPTLPGTIYTVADEVKALGVDSLAVKTDLRDEKVSLGPCLNIRYRYKCTDRKHVQHKLIKLDKSITQCSSKI